MPVALETLDAAESFFRAATKQDMPSWLLGGLHTEANRKKASAGQIRFYTDAIASAQIHCDPVLHRHFSLLSTIEDREKKEHVSGLFDALELARCASRLKQDGLAGANLNVVQQLDVDQGDMPLLGASRMQQEIFGLFLRANQLFSAHPGAEHPEHARFKNFADQSRREYGVLVDILTNPERYTSQLSLLVNFLDDQKKFGEAAWPICESLADSLVASWPTDQIQPTPQGNPLLASVFGKTESHFLLSAFRRWYQDEAPAHVVYEQDSSVLPGNTSEKPKAQPDFQDGELRRLFGGRVSTQQGYTLVDIPERKGKKPQKPILFVAKFQSPVELVPEPKIRARLRQELDDYEGKTNARSQPLRRKLLRVSNALRLSQWQDAEEGILNPKYLARRIIDPTAVDIMLARSQHLIKDAAVTLLLDNSGSMEDEQESYKAAAAAVDKTTEAFELNGAKVEAIGFTSTSVNIKELSPRHRQRLLEHKSRGDDMGTAARIVVYKEHREPWRRARRNMGVALNTSFFLGTPEGEALLFAYLRLLMRPESKKILMVIGDSGANNVALLQSTIERIQAEKQVYLAAIGIGIKMNPFYPVSIGINNAGELYGAFPYSLAERLV